MGVSCDLQGVVHVVQYLIDKLGKKNATRDLLIGFENAFNKVFRQVYFFGCGILPAVLL